MSYQLAVLFGGVSNENEISVITGTMVCNILTRGGHKVLPIYMDTEGDLYTGESLFELSTYRTQQYKQEGTILFDRGGVWLKGKRTKLKKFFAVDCLVNCCHGGAGEGGGVSGLCALFGIPLASAGVFESSAFLNKYFTKLVLNSLKIPTAPYVFATTEQQAEEAATKFSYPLIVKPVSLGSSIGVQKVTSQEELHEAMQSALMLDSGALIEPYFAERREVNCAAYYAENAVTVSPCEEVLTGGDYLSFDDKYAGGGRSVFPADLPDEIANTIQQYTRTVYQTLQMRGIVRFDFLVVANAVYVCEVNTVPGSLSYYLLAEGPNKFQTFYPILCKLIEQARGDYEQFKQKMVLHTGILEKYTGKACKGGTK
jgi:D-alanine-D-alanine ligase